MGIRPLGWKDLSEKVMPTHSTILAQRTPWTEKPVDCSPWGRRESDMTEWLKLSLSFFFIFFSIVAYHRLLSIVPCAVQYDLVILSIL